MCVETGVKVGVRVRVRVRVCVRVFGECGGVKLCPPICKKRKTYICNRHFFQGRAYICKKMLAYTRMK